MPSMGFHRKPYGSPHGRLAMGCKCLWIRIHEGTPSLRGSGNRAQPLGRCFVRRQRAQLRVVPDRHRCLFKLRLVDRHPTLVKTLGALRYPLGWCHFVHGGMILYKYTGCARFSARRSVSVAQGAKPGRVRGFCRNRRAPSSCRSRRWRGSTGAPKSGFPPLQ